MCKFSILGLLVVRYFWRKKVYRALFFAKFGLNLKIVRYWLVGIKHTACNAGFFFQRFRENSAAKKTQFLPSGQKLKAIFLQKLKVGAAVI